MHVLPRVGELHERFSDILTVVGVHAGKFRAERETGRIASARRRLHVAHAVVNDRHVRIWRSYGVRAWPTVALVAPDGGLMGTLAGEFETEALAEAIERAAEEHRRDGTLRPGPEPFETLTLEQPSGPLAFPARTLVEGGTLFISDAGGRRVLEAEFLRSGPEATARVRRVWGDGAAGLADGDASECRFAEPQGLALLGDALYVADRANHAVRRLDLATGEASTVAGTGRLAAGAIGEGDPATPLRSPWGLLARGSDLLVSMAGSHQLFALEGLEGGSPRLRLVAGTGAEDIRDGRALSSALAQPTGLAAGPGGAVYVADCESSAVRELAGERVRSVVGTGLFDFGDKDGLPGEALLQHAEDVAFHGGELVVADTYNDKLKTVEPAGGRTVTMPGGAGSALSGPRGVLSLGDALLVADTDAHRLVLADATGTLSEVRVLM